METGLELGVGDLLALEVFGHDVVIGLGRCLEQLVPAGGDFIGQIRRNRDLGLLASL